MHADNQLILIVSDDRKAARHLQELLEFMDAPLVECAMPEQWQSHLGNRRLSAVFLGPGLDIKTSGNIIGEIGELDPNISIVVVDANAKGSDPK